LAVTRAGQKGIMVLITLVPFAAVIAAIWLLWDSAVSSDDLALFGLFYVMCALGITVGFHRMLTHRAFLAHPALRFVL
jgi:stearoyl-CoA desaturase (delta-9 desaturase)